MSTRRGPRDAVTKTSAFYASLSPPLWKDQLRQRCMERLKQNRHELLAKLRSPDANISDEMKRLVYSEEKRQGHHSGKTGTNKGPRRSARRPVFAVDAETTEDGEENALVSIEDLMATGQLSEQDYLDIVHSLEDELRNEWDAGDAEEERLVEEMVEFEEASLAAMLAGMDLDEFTTEYEYDDEFGGDTMLDDTDADVHSGGVRVLCPICKTGSLYETGDQVGGHSTVACSCGFSLRVKNILHGALEDLQEKIANAFMDHRSQCASDPTFAVVSDLDAENDVVDSLLMYCDTCDHECLVR